MVETPQPHGALTLALADGEATAALSRRLAARVRPGDVIALSGDLGAGKTTFARAFINALPDPDRAPGEAADEEVPSPTFTLVQIYRRQPADVWHLDLYRLEHPEEAYELGIEEALGQAILLIEWPERLGALLPRERLDIELRFAEAEGARTARVTGCGGWAERLAGLAPGGPAPAEPAEAPA